jgi:hypothetical protein
MAKTIILKSEQDRTFCKSYLEQMTLDGKSQVEFKKVPTDATYKQQKLWMMWCGEVADSGLGSHCVQNDVHIGAKWQFVRLILLEENEMFAKIYNLFMETIKNDGLYSEHCKTFADEWIRTNTLTRAGRIKSLDEFWKYWCVEHGINLTDPKSQGCDFDKMSRNKKLT